MSETVDPPVPPPRQDRVPLGIVFMLGATLMFAGSSAISKWLVVTYPVGEVLFARTALGLLAVWTIILPTTGLAVYRTGRTRAHFLRAFSQTVSQSLIVLAFSLMPLASAFAINFSSPLFATLAAIILFKETVGPARWAALLVGFLGVLVITNPGTGAFQIGSLFALGNAILYGTVTAAVRGMTATESTETLLTYQFTFMSLLFGLMLPFGFVMPGWDDAGLMVVNGVANGLGQYWWTRALHLAPASAVTPFYYFTLVWAIGIGLLVWGDVPSPSLLAGSAIVAGSGLFLLWRETRPRPPIPPQAA